MPILKDQPIASTLEDAHGERRTPEQLRGLFDTMPAENVMYNQHSPASEPVARSFNKRFVQRDDGEYVIIVDLEVYNEDLFYKMGGYSISYTTAPYSVAPDQKPQLQVLFNPLEFPPEDFNTLALRTADGFQLDVVKWHQKAVSGAAIVALVFIGTTAAGWFINKLLDGGLNAFKIGIKALSAKRQANTGESTSFELILPINVDGNEVEVLAEISLADFDRLGVPQLTIPNAEELVASRIRGRNVRKAVLKVAPDSPRWVLANAITHDNKTLIFKEDPTKRNAGTARGP